MNKWTVDVALDDFGDSWWLKYDDTAYGQFYDKDVAEAIANELNCNGFVMEPEDKKT